ncbi:MAG: hypothetical protein HY931_03520 [Candidatus Falkowbacteria bacterium]|nr:MAG: hypothetical protein HY931_03520 [Candidatus Falkowbacteria bacterium]
MRITEKIVEKDWLDAYKWQYQAYPFFTSVYVLASTIKPSSRYNVYWGDFLNNFVNGNLVAFKQSGKISKIGREIIKETLIENDNYLQELKRLHQKLKLAIKKCEKARQSKNIKLEQWWDDTQNSLSQVANLLFSFDFPFDKFLLELSIKNPKDFEYITGKINNNRPSFMSAAGFYLLALNKKYKNFKIVLDEFNKKFSWVQNTYSGPYAITEKWLKNYLQELKLAKPVLKNQPVKIKPSKDYSHLIKLAKHSAEFRDDKKKLLLLAVDLMDSWLKGICLKNKFTYKDLRWLTIDEVKKLVFDNKIEYLAKAKSYEKNRRRLGLMLSPGYQDVSDKFWKKVVKLNDKNENNILHGIPASPGFYRGKIKVILDVCLGAKQFKNGEILVTSMTRPEFLPLMSKAAAFITEEGGISCHAAIVAREMKKPCIIGIKNATKILKNGDIVEVDAKRGIVTKLIK